MESPKIYVASLTDYNNGRLEGKWFDFADYSDASELMKAIDDMLKELTKKYNDGDIREEYAVHDYENIPSSLASEYMGERDFEVIYELMEVAEDSNIPLDVLMERAGDVGSDDYQAIVDSLVMVVDGSDETDIVYQLEQEMGSLGNDFWKNHIYIDDVTERVMYGEDVDRYREDILYENPDMDENEAEEQAEEMASDEAERRKDDLIGYLEEMGYEDIPTFVSKDYESAWNEISNDYDVIHTTNEMYVFSNNYSVGGVVIGGLLGAYLGYNYGISTKRKKLALGGSTNSGLSWHQDHKRHNKSESYEIPMSKRKFADGGGIYSSDELYILKVSDLNGNLLDSSKKLRARNLSEAKQIAIDDFEYDMLQKYGQDLRFKVELAPSMMADGGNIGMSKAKVGDSARVKSENKMGVIVKDYGRKFHLRFANGKEKTYDASELEFYNFDEEEFAEGGGIQIGGIYKVDGKDYLFDSPKQNANGQYTSWMAYEVVYDMKEGEKHINYERTKKAIRLKSFPNNVKRENVSSDYFADGGSIGFKGLSNKVAKRYEGKKVAPKYQGQYGKRYSKNEAIEVGNKVAGKVYREQQMGRKMADGGMVGREIEFNQYGESRTGKIYEDYGDDTYGVQSGTSKVLVEKGDITRTLEPQMKRKFGFFEDGGGVEEERVYIEYLNKDKGFKRDRIEFDSYKEAVEWGKKHFEKFHPDMINYFDGGGNVRDDEWYQMWNHKNNYSSWNTYSLKRGIEDYDIKEQNGHTLTDSEISEIESMFKELHKRGETYKLGDKQNNLR